MMGFSFLVPKNLFTCPNHQPSRTHACRRFLFKSLKAKESVSENKRHFISTSFPTWALYSFGISCDFLGLPLCPSKQEQTKTDRSGRFVHNTIINRPRGKSAGTVTVLCCSGFMRAVRLSDSSISSRVIRLAIQRKIIGSYYQFLIDNLPLSLVPPLLK